MRRGFLPTCFQRSASALLLVASSRPTRIGQAARRSRFSVTPCGGDVSTATRKLSVARSHWTAKAILSSRLVRSFLQMVAVPKGFNPDGVLTLDLAPNLSKFPWDEPRREAYFQELLARIQALPGIQSAGLTSFLPLARPEMAAPIQVEG